MDEAPLFKASKRRRLGHPKQARTDDDNEASNHSHPAYVPSGHDDGEGEVKGNGKHENDKETETTSVATLIKARKQKARQGVSFSNTKLSKSGVLGGGDNLYGLDMIQAPTSEDVLKNIPSRFTTGIGHAVNVDEHMIAYIDSQMGKRNVPASQSAISNTRKKIGQDQSSASDDAHTDASDTDDRGDDDVFNENGNDTRQQTSQGTPVSGRQATSASTSKSTIPVHNQPHSLKEVSVENLPSAATKREPRLRRPRKPRLGRDGKPFRPRPRKRANSADQARDRLVEQILQENRRIDDLTAAAATTTTATTALHGGQHHARQTTTGTASNLSNTIDESSNPPPPPPLLPAGMNVEADERVAAEFRRQFMEHAAERRLRAQAQHQHNQNVKQSGSGGGNKKGGTTGAGGAGGSGGTGGKIMPDGPKLGGSRSARAKMYAARLAEREKEKEKGLAKDGDGAK